MHLFHRDPDFVIFAVETDAMGDRKVSIMFAGRHGTRISYPGGFWNGYDYEVLRRGIIEPRAAVWF